MQLRSTVPDEPLRILQVAGTAVGGDWFYDQVTALSRLGHTVCVVLPRHGPLAERLVAAGIPVEIIPFGLTRRLRQLPISPPPSCGCSVSSAHSGQT